MAGSWVRLPPFVHCSCQKAPSRSRCRYALAGNGVVHWGERSAPLQPHAHERWQTGGRDLGWGVACYVTCPAASIGGGAASRGLSGVGVLRGRQLLVGGMFVCADEAAGGDGPQDPGEETCTSECRCL